MIEQDNKKSPLPQQRVEQVHAALPLLHQYRNWLVGVLVLALVIALLVLFSPSGWRTPVQLLGLTAAVVGLFSYAGFGLTWLLRSWRLAPVLPLFTPVVGLAGLIAAGHALGYLPWGTNHTAWLLVAGCTAINILAWRQGARPWLNRTHGLALVGGAVALILGLLPLYVLGYVTTLGGSIDALFYLVRAEYRQVGGVMTLPPADLLVPPYMGHIRAQMALREGDTFLLAVLSSLLHVRPYVVFSVLMACWFALTPIGVFALAISELRLNRWIAFVASLLVAIQSLVHTPILNNGFSQAAGMAIWCFVLIAVLHALRQGTWRTILLAGLLVVTLTTLYPPYLIYMVPVIGLVALAELAERSRTILARVPAASLSERLRLLLRPLVVLLKRGMGLAVAALAIMPFAWLLFLNHMDLTNQAAGRNLTRPRGDIREFPHLGEIIGVVNHIEAAYHRGLPQLPLSLATILLGLALALLLYGLLAQRGRRRWLLMALVVALGAAMGHVRFWIAQGSGDAYLYYKVVSLACPMFLLLCVVGMSRLYQRVGVLSESMRLAARGGLVVFACVIGAIALFHSVVSAWYVGDGGGVIASHEMFDLQHIDQLVPPAEPLLIIDLTNPGQVWASYFLNRPRVYYRQPALTYWVPTQSYSPQPIHYALIAYPDRAWPWNEVAAEPWFDVSAHEVLWQNAIYRLVRRTDEGVMAEFPLFLDGFAPALHTPFHIEIANGLIRLPDVLAQGGILQQQLTDTPQQLELVVYSEGENSVQIEQPATGIVQQIPLRPGQQTEIVFALDEPASLSITQVQPSAVPISLFAVRLLHQPDQPVSYQRTTMP